MCCFDSSCISEGCLPDIGQSELTLHQLQLNDHVPPRPDCSCRIATSVSHTLSPHFSSLKPIARLVSMLCQTSSNSRVIAFLHVTLCHFQVQLTLVRWQESMMLPQVVAQALSPFVQLSFVIESPKTQWYALAQHGGILSCHHSLFSMQFSNLMLCGCSTSLLH